MSLIMSWMHSTPLPAQNVIGACFRLLWSFKLVCGKQLLACMAGLTFLARLNLASKFSFEVGSMREWIDDVRPIVLQ